MHTNAGDGVLAKDARKRLIQFISDSLSNRHDNIISAENMEPIGYDQVFRERPAADRPRDGPGPAQGLPGDGAGSACATLVR